jgi:hypothetical protein
MRRLHPMQIARSYRQHPFNILNVAIAHEEVLAVQLGYQQRQTWRPGDLGQSFEQSGETCRMPTDPRTEEVWVVDAQAFPIWLLNQSSSSGPDY